MPPDGVGPYSWQDLQIYAGNHRVMPCTIGLSQFNSNMDSVAIDAVCTLQPAALAVWYPSKAEKPSTSP